MTERRSTGEFVKGKVLPRVPMRRWGVGDDFGAIAVYLASDASRYHTGDAFIIDGGYLDLLGPGPRSRRRRCRRPRAS